ncbi:hypothetical protein [Pseudoduganella lutea]|uniref:Uncharacterized protein n=1 Tax=Pseudoduganella lutea TaxID=321985 RepID=A0A4P6KRM4_9BURK|nr:hypothetical protein [Pseudoduganella lutea]QBE61741.1 hypothetical protein EWM63_00955 [Pseudoduganella lutea]
MTIDKITKFLGLPAQNIEFDKYLATHGISHRPVFRETPVDRISLESSGLSLVFDTAGLYEEMYGPLSEKGSMIFSELQIYGAVNDSGFEQYPGPLPYGLSFKSTSAEAINIFGSPTVSHTYGEQRSLVWYDYDGNTIGITFLQEDQGISWLGLSKAAKKPPEQDDWD